MKNLKNALAPGTAAAVAAVWIASVAAQTTTTGPAVKPAGAASKAGMTPPAGSKTTKTAGGAKTSVSTANNASDDDSFWIERIDFDGDGNIEDTNLVWDDEDKVLFTYSAGAFTCSGGGTATGELLVATFGDGNPRKQPTGSGFWVADLDAGECGAKTSGLWGCKFDAKGNETACGVAVLDEKNDDLTIVTAAK